MRNLLTKRRREKKKARNHGGGKLRDVGEEQAGEAHWRVF